MQTAQPTAETATAYVRQTLAHLAGLKIEGDNAGEYDGVVDVRFHYGAVSASDKGWFGVMTVWALPDGSLYGEW